MLSIRGLSIRYRSPTGSLEALSEVSLELKRGEALAIVGESGSGKSTVALAVMGLLPSEASVAGGRVLLDGQDVLVLHETERRALRGTRMALVFQDPFSVLNPSLRVGRQIGEGLVHHRGLSPEEALRRATGLLREVGIADADAVASAYPHELSGGMRQRALIAGALAAEPELLILDEPTTALDVTIEAQILDLLADLREKRGLAMLFITHNLGVVRRIADRVAVLYAGEVVEEGPARKVLSQPVHPYAKGLVASIPRIGERHATLASIAGRLPDLRRIEPGCRFRPRCPFAGEGCEAKPDLITLGESERVRCHRSEPVRGLGWPGEERPPARQPATASASPEPLVETHDLCKTFTLTRGLAALKREGWKLVLRPVRVPAVDRITLSIAPGEVLGLVGESGSGKTTLGRTILRLVNPDTGLLRVQGEDVTKVPQGRLAGMRRVAQIVFQNPDSSLNPRKTVREIIARPIVRFGLASSAEADQRVAKLLDLVRLPAYYADRYPHQMSGGEKQRVGIARALATEPRFIVCDEPVSALDVSVQAAIVNLLAELRDRLSVAYLLISHDISVVAHLADRIAVMYRGRIVEIGPRDEVLRPPYHPYTEALLSAVPTLDGEVADRIRLPLEARRSVQSIGCVFAARCPRRKGPECEKVVPPLRDLGRGHRLECHHHRGVEKA
jgi:peptide/nickel transport system ATP-binding protein